MLFVLPERWDVFSGIRDWIAEAADHPHIRYPDAACLTTLSPDGFPEGRMVLVRDITDTHLVFYTNTQSHKGASLRHHPRAGLTFYWDSLGRQIRVSGTISLVSDAISDAYFASRPRMSQLGAWASQQSTPLPSRDYLIDEVARYDRLYPATVPRPPHWQGYALTPLQVEFWQEGEYRLHDRWVDHPVSPEPGTPWQGHRQYP